MRELLENEEKNRLQKEQIESERSER